jgi:hypothetical protein
MEIFFVNKKILYIDNRSNDSKTRHLQASVNINKKTEEFLKQKRIPSDILAFNRNEKHAKY